MAHWTPTITIAWRVLPVTRASIWPDTRRATTKAASRSAEIRRKRVKPLLCLALWPRIIIILVQQREPPWNWSIWATALPPTPSIQDSTIRWKVGMYSETPLWRIRLYENSVLTDTICLSLEIRFSRIYKTVALPPTALINYITETFGVKKECLYQYKWLHQRDFYILTS